MKTWSLQKVAKKIYHQFLFLNVLPNPLSFKTVRKRETYLCMLAHTMMWHTQAIVNTRLDMNVVSNLQDEGDDTENKLSPSKEHSDFFWVNIP